MEKHLLDILDADAMDRIYQHAHDILSLENTSIYLKTNRLSSIFGSSHLKKLLTPDTKDAISRIDTQTPDQVISFLRDNPNITNACTVPRLPSLPPDMPVTSCIESIQAYIPTLTYNYLGEPFFLVKKSASVRNLMRLAQGIIQSSLPIKCLEATIVGAYLTMKFDNLCRIPVSFKSECEGNTHRHIVLALKYGVKWGAIGLSRRNDLMNKPMAFTSLAALLSEFKACYEKNGHKLLKIKIGLPMTHSAVSSEQFAWKRASFSLTNRPWQTICKEIDVYSRSIRGL